MSVIYCFISVILYFIHLIPFVTLIVLLEIDLDPVIARTVGITSTGAMIAYCKYFTENMEKYGIKFVFYFYRYHILEFFSRSHKFVKDDREEIPVYSCKSYRITKN